jgi:hypothetical protein
MLTRLTDIFVYYTETGENIHFLVLAITGGGERKRERYRERERERER